MPTSYTYAVQEGKVTEFKDFAMNCVRAMGVCIMMRDDSANAPIPERWEPNVKYYQDNIQELLKKKQELEAMTVYDIEVACAKEYEELCVACRESKQKDEVQKKRYEDMLKKVEKWVPPTEEHAGLKKFMISQLKESIRFDCDFPFRKPALVPPDKWYATKLESVNNSIKYYTKSMNEEIERTESRNKYMAQLRKSLEEQGI